jgi:sterol desaturase/sphingolipid hydroxylase (fatty acid hydroxylase superfamily)
MTYLLIFLGWTLMVYVIHRLAHVIPFMRKFHDDHHDQVVGGGIQGPNWRNLLLFFDTWRSTADQWLVEVIPTIIFAAVTGHWWIAIAYYIWAALIQESIEHNERVDLYPFLTSGRWHLVHHRDPNSNFGVFVPIWDLAFGTWKRS